MLTRSHLLISSSSFQTAQRGRKKKVVAASDSADEPKATSNEPTTSTSEPASTEPAATKPAKGRGKKVDQPPAAENVIDEGNRSEDESELVIDLKDEQPAASASPAKKRGRKPKANTKEVSTESKTVEDAQPSGDVQPSADAQPATESSDKPSKRPRAKKQKTEKSAAEVATEVQADASEAPALNTESEITDAPAAEDAQPAGDNQSATETSDKPVKRVRAKKQANATKVPADTTDAPAKRGKRKVPPVKEDNEVSSTNDKDNSTGKPTDKPDATAEQPNKPVDASKTAATECHDSDVQTVLCDIKSQVEKSSLTGGGLEDLREAQTTWTEEVWRISEMLELREEHPVRSWSEGVPRGSNLERSRTPTNSRACTNDMVVEDATILSPFFKNFFNALYSSSSPFAPGACWPTSQSPVWIGIFRIFERPVR